MVPGLHRRGILLLLAHIRAPEMLPLHGLQVRRQQELGSYLGCTLVSTLQMIVRRQKWLWNQWTHVLLNSLF